MKTAKIICPSLIHNVFVITLFVLPEDLDHDNVIGSNSGMILRQVCLMQKVKVWLVSMVELAPVGQYHNY